MKKVKITDKAIETLKVELGEAERQIGAGVITFKNSKGEERDCAYSAFTHTGRIAVTREEDSETFDKAVAVILRVEAEKRRSGNVASAKATHSLKLSTASVTIRHAGMEAGKADVTCQLAAAQRLAGMVRDIRAEMYRRDNAERLAAEAAAKAKAVKDVEDYLNGCAGVPTVKVLQAA